MVLYEKCGSELREETGDPSSTAKHAHDPRSLLEETELEILQTQARLQQLVQKRVSSKKEVNDRSSPVLRLPTELSTKILFDCLPDIDVDSYGSMTPFYLGNICRTWRDLVWSTPRIWSLICIDLSSAMTIELVEEWLLRSHTLPLSIGLTYQPFPQHDDDDRGHITGLVTAIARVSERWQIIHFCLWDWCLRLLCAGIQNPPAQLVSMSFNSWSHVVSELPPQMFLFSPQLHTIQLRRCKFRGIPASLLGQITRCSFT
jgi:hypothetical protein